MCINCIAIKASSILAQDEKRGRGNLVTQTLENKDVLCSIMYFQNIASLHVVGTRFDTIQDLETQNVGKYISWSYWISHYCKYSTVLYVPKGENKNKTVVA